jgi:predicted MPP superfamily phosphohydrolase
VPFFVLAVALLPLLGLYATLHEPYRPVFRRHKVTLNKTWPKDLSIVHISDLHVRRSDRRLLKAQKQAIQGLKPDIVCVTGDVCEKVEDIDLLIDVLNQPKPRLGTFIVLGNHEHNAQAPQQIRDEHKSGWKRALAKALHAAARHQRSEGDHEAHEMAEALETAGFTVLHNQGVRIETGENESLWIAGCDSAWAGHADMLAAMNGRQQHEPCLALIHEPDMAFEAHAHGADLILAGHTHGGQVKLPLLGAPYTLKVDPRISIAAGFQRIGEGLLHITAGLGHTIPLRFGCPPEVAWLECSAT